MSVNQGGQDRPTKKNLMREGNRTEHNKNQIMVDLTKKIKKLDVVQCLVRTINLKKE